MNNFMVKLVQNDIRNSEFDQMVNMLREVDFTEKSQVEGALRYKEKDRSKRLQEQSRIQQEFFSGKFDPKKLEMRKKVKKK